MVKSGIVITNVEERIHIFLSEEISLAIKYVGKTAELMRIQFIAAITSTLVVTLSNKYAGNNTNEYKQFWKE